MSSRYDNLLANVPTDLWIGGKWRKSSDGGRFDVLDPATEDFKKSAQEFLDLADAVILHAPEQAEAKPVWRGVSLRSVARCPIFHIQPPQYVTRQIVEFVRKKLGSSS